MSDEFPDPPEPQSLDRVYGIAHAAGSFVPLLGAAVDLVETVFGPPLTRRMQGWYVLVAEVLRELQSRSVDTDSPEFVSAVARASSIALGTHLDEKLRMLQAAILHAALPDRPADFVTMRFLRFVDELDPEHFLVLTFLRDPAGHYERRYLPIPTRQEIEPVDETAFAWSQLSIGQLLRATDIPVDHDHLPLIYHDLAQRQLVHAGNLEAQTSWESIWEPWATDLGGQFLDFVTYAAPARDPDCATVLNESSISPQASAKP
ncbi:MAG: hypothetical protein ACK5OX_17165 [Desertimonas sp.]